MDLFQARAFKKHDGKFIRGLKLFAGKDEVIETFTLRMAFIIQSIFLSELDYKV